MRSVFVSLFVYKNSVFSMDSQIIHWFASFLSSESWEAKKILSPCLVNAQGLFTVKTKIISSLDSLPVLPMLPWIRWSMYGMCSSAVPSWRRTVWHWLWPVMTCCVESRTIGIRYPTTQRSTAIICMSILISCLRQNTFSKSFFQIIEMNGKFHFDDFLISSGRKK